MSPLKIVALLLIVGGIVGLVYGGFTYTKSTHDAKIGPLEFSIKDKERVNVPVWAGVAAIVVGGVLLGLYLLISVQVFGRHSNEAFSSLRIQDYKQWLRMHFAADGTLTIFAIGIDRVPRRTPDDPRATPPHLIEKVVLQR